MAKKGQKFNKYSAEMRIEIVTKYLNAKGSARSLAKEHNISYKTVDNWIYQYKHGHDLVSKNHLKGRRKESEINYKEKYEILKKFQTFLKAQRERK